MKFSTREDIEAPIEHVWAQITDCDGFERQAMRRGAEIRRTDTQGKPGIGTEWDISVEFRGKQRRIEAQIVDYDAPNGMRVESRSGGVEGRIAVDLIVLSPRRTRMQLSLDLKPVNISGRLLVQSLKFARATLNRRFRDRVGSFAQGLAVQYREAS